MRRFIGKNPTRKYVRQIPQRNMVHDVSEENKNELKARLINKNNTDKKEENMADERLKKIEQITGTKAPKRRVKVEKKDKGLIERTEDSTILLTEENKMLLND